MFGPERFMRIGLTAQPFALQVQPLWYTAMFDSERGRVAFKQMLVVSDYVASDAAEVLIQSGTSNDDDIQPLRQTWVTFIDSWLVHREACLLEQRRQLLVPALQNATAKRELEQIAQVRSRLNHQNAGGRFGAVNSLNGFVNLKHWSFQRHLEDRDYWGFQLDLCTPLDGAVWFGTAVEAEFFRSLLANRTSCLLLAARLLTDALHHCLDDEAHELRRVRDSAFWSAMGDFTWVELDTSLGQALERVGDTE